MTILSAIQKAVLRCTGDTVNKVFSSDDTVAAEMADLSNEVAQDIVSGFDWRSLTKIATLTGDTTVFPVPSDYDRMISNSVVADPVSWFWNYTPFQSVSDWRKFVDGGYGLIVPGGWIIIDGAFNFYPAPHDGATFPYLSKDYARDSDGNTKAEFDQDDDSFILDERLLTLGLVWRWKAQKGLAYAEDMATYETALARAQAKDKGWKPLLETRPRSGWNYSRAYPWGLG